MASDDQDFQKLMHRLQRSQKDDTAQFRQDQERVLAELDKAMDRSASASELTLKAAKDMRSSIVDRIPSVADITNSFIDANPALSMVKKLGMSLGGAIDPKEAAKDRQKELARMREAVESLTVSEPAPVANEPAPVANEPAPVANEPAQAIYEPNVTVEPQELHINVPPQQVERVDTSGFEALRPVQVDMPSDRVEAADVSKLEELGSIQVEILADLYEVWAGSAHILADQLKYDRRLAEMAAEADREDDRADLRGEGPETFKGPNLPDHLVGAERVEEDPSLLDNAMDDIIGSVIGNSIGKVTSLAAATATGIGKLASKSLKLLGPIGAVVGTLYSFYEGFSDPEAVLGRDGTELSDKIQAGAVNIFTSIASMVDWVIGFAGFDFDLEGKTREIAIRYTDYLRDMLEAIPNLAASVRDGVTNAFEQMQQDAMAKAEAAFDMAGGAKEYMGAMVSSVVTGVTDWLVDMLSAMKDVPLIGDHIQAAIDKIQGLSEGNTVPDTPPKSARSESVATIKSEGMSAIQREREERIARQQAEQAQISAIHQNVNKTNVNNTTYTSMEPNVHNDEPTRKRLGFEYGAY